jgi:hypothetical protein
VPNDSIARRPISQTAVGTLVVAIAALALWHGHGVDWLKWRSNASLISSLVNSIDSPESFELDRELSRRFRAGKLTQGDLDALASHALEVLAKAPRLSGGPSWPDSVLTMLNVAGKLSEPNYQRYFRTKLETGGIAMGLFSEGLPTRRTVGVVLALRSVVPAFYRVELIPDDERVQTDGKKYRLTGEFASMHGFTSINWAGRESPATIKFAARIRATPPSKPNGKAVWEGVIYFSNVAWPAPGVAMKDASLETGELVHSTFQPSAEP